MTRLLIANICGWERKFLGLFWNGTLTGSTRPMEEGELRDWMRSVGFRPLEIDDRVRFAKQKPV